MRRRGLSLLEVMLSIGLLALVVVGLLTVLSGGLGLLNQANQMGVARGVALSEMEAVKAGAWNYHPDGTSFDGQPSVGDYPPAPYPAQTVDGQTYRIRVDVAAVAANLRSIRVQVSWGKNHSTDLQTLVNP